MNNLSTTQVDELPAESRSIIEMLKQFASLSQILRIAGAFSVVASMSIFLLQGWESGNDINRFYLLISQTILLATAGFGLAFLLKENKGARVFFALGLVSIVANMTTLGALIFSFVQWGGALSDYPDIALWSVKNATSIGQALAIAALVLIPVTLFGFKIMARRSAIPLTVAYLLSASMLLIPVRDSLYTSIIAGASVLLALGFVSRLLIKDTSLRTMEGVFARVLLFVPPVIMLVRSLWLYQTDLLILSIFASTAYMTLRHCSLQFAGDNRIRKFMELISIPAAFMLAACVSQLIDDLVSFALLLPAFATVFSLIMLDLAKRTQVYKKQIMVCASLVTSLCFIFHLSIYGGLLNGLVCAFFGLVMLTLGYVYKAKTVLMAGAITAVVALIYDVVELYATVDLLNWTSLAIIGVTAIIIGSVIERHGVVIKLRVDNFIKNIETRMA